MVAYTSIDPVAISFGFVKIHWYGLMYVTGFAGAWWLASIRAKNSNGLWKQEYVSDLIFYGAIGVILGGRFGYVIFYNFDYFILHPFWLFRIWEGGMSFHGGLLGVILAMAVCSRKLDKSFSQTVDFIAPLVPVGLGAGRIGNFIGGELWGRATDVSWAMVFPRDPDQIARHPSQLYQFALEGVVLFIVLWWFSSRPRPRMAISGLFLLVYGLVRIVVEFFREPDAHLGYLAFDWLTMGQILSLPMVILGSWFIYYGYKYNIMSGGMNIDDIAWLKRNKAN
ncbi:MAG: prolipoprotein diacylglyceryl transferase [Candidatus Endonucleobacter bathymodioli]|uniref:Phosphatidylglycerol--prolipoprotein diacylglyceryl transferase n=1 Tax=Candidatus Endonucleibacter bathymodioli TaxID=539814 RepID=A0AA90NTP8_9GAMM|nr:prolipoprotein diacylglyceryl transferase [Candidatus Endonucleobacter bathymodioli]